MRFTYPQNRSGDGPAVFRLLQPVSPQSELQEVLGAEEDAGPLEGEEPASHKDYEEEKGQEDTEAPAAATPLAAPVPAAQVSCGVVLGSVIIERGWQAGPSSRSAQAEAEHKHFLVTAGLKGLSVLQGHPPLPLPGLHRWSGPVFAADTASGLSRESLPPTLRPEGSCFSWNAKTPIFLGWLPCREGAARA